MERVLLETRLRSGLAVMSLDPVGRSALPDLAGRGLVEPDAVAAGRVVLTLRAGGCSPTPSCAICCREPCRAQLTRRIVNG